MKNISGIFSNVFNYLFSSASVEEKLDEIDFSNKFISLSINKNLSESVSMSRVIQLENLIDSKSQYVLSTKDDETTVKVFEKNKLVAFSKNDSDSLNERYIEKIINLYDFSMRRAKELLLEDSEVNSDLTSETRGLEWLRVSLVVLKSAVNKSIDDSSLVFDGQFFFGQRDVTGPYQMRIQCLSLDFLLELLNDGRLRLTVWNYKNSQPNSKEAPVFTGEFVKVKQRVFDEFIELIVLMSKATTKIYTKA